VREPVAVYGEPAPEVPDSYASISWARVRVSRTATP
jgi:hypothetical protein